MSPKRVIYQNWIVETGFDPSKTSNDFTENFIEILSLEDLIESDRSGEILQNLENDDVKKLRQAVRDALEMLTEDEREFIIRFYFMGEAYADISEKSNRAIHKLSALHKRAVKKLKNNLTEYVALKYGIKNIEENSCSICESQYKTEINQLIKRRNKRKTWKPIMDEIKLKYNLKINPPQVLISHEKYHITK